MAKTVLVTGGAGYIGSHACKALAGAGYTPVTYDSLSTGNRWAVQRGPLEVGDICDEGRLRAVIEAHRPAAAMHFAALALVSESMRDPAFYYLSTSADLVCPVFTHLAREPFRELQLNHRRHQAFRLLGELFRNLLCRGRIGQPLNPC